MRIRVIGVPSAWGTKELGARRTPAALREAGLLDWLAAPGLEVEDGGDVEVPEQTEADLWEARAAARDRSGPAATPAPAMLDRAPAASTDGADRPAAPPLIHLEEVVAMASAVRDAVGEALGAGTVPLLVGGECCLAIGAAAALAAARGPITTAWLDAHGDLNTPETSESGLITGMPFAVVLGHGEPALLDVGAGAPRPEPARTWLLGGRDLDAGEAANLAAFGLNHLSTEEARALGPEEVAMRILGVPEDRVLPPAARAEASLAAGDRDAAPSAAAAPAEAAVATQAAPAGLEPPAPVYLHFDVDSIDPEEAPGVHYRVAGGFTAAEVGTLAGYLCASGRVEAIAVASANLDHDRDGRTIAVIRDVLVSVADALSLSS